MTKTEKIENLKDRMVKVLMKPYNANRNHVNKIATQIRYLEKFVQPEVKETVK